MANYYCPECHSQLERESGCGSVSYFCNTCRTIISRSKILTGEELAALPKESTPQEKKWWED